MLALKHSCKFLAAALLLFSGNEVFAEQPSLKDYCSLVCSGKYLIEATISHNNSSNSKQDISRQYVMLVENGDTRYFRLYKENVGTKKRDYFLIRRYNSSTEEKYSYKYTDKPITNFDIGWGKKSIERWFGAGYVQETIRNEVQNSNDELLSMLGPITSLNNKLSRYKVKYLRSGNWTKNGITYNYDQYELLEPVSGVLIMCYDKGVLSLCIERQRKQKSENDGFGNYQLDESKAVVAEIKAFNNVFEDKYFNIDKA